MTPQVATLPTSACKKLSTVLDVLELRVQIVRDGSQAKLREIRWLMDPSE